MVNLLLTAATLLAPCAPGAFLEGDRMLTMLVDEAEAPAAARLALFEQAFVEPRVCGWRCEVGSPLPQEWLEAVRQAGAVPWLRVEWDAGWSEAEATLLGEAVADVPEGAWVDLLPIASASDAYAWDALAGRLVGAIRQAAPRSRIVKSADSRSPDAAAKAWREDAPRIFDAIGVQVAMGCPFCDGSRDIAAELAALEPRLHQRGLPIVLSRVYAAHECHECGARFPEHAAMGLATVFEWARSAGVEVVMLDSTDATPDPLSGPSGTSGGICSSTTVSTMYARLVGSSSSPQAGVEMAVEPAMPVDHSAWWLAAAVALSVLLCVGAFILGGRGAPVAHGGRSGGYRGLAALMVLSGGIVMAYPHLTEAFGGPERAPVHLPARWLVLGEPGVAVEVCSGPYSIALPAIGVVEPVREDATLDNLRGGPCHYVGTAAPGEPANCCIAGHRSTYTAPFRRLLEMRPGDEVIISGESGFRRVYHVAWVREVDARDGRYLAPTPNEALTLSTCHPFGLASQRLMLRAYPGRRGTAAARARPTDEVWLMGGGTLLTSASLGLEPGSTTPEWTARRHGTPLPPTWSSEWVDAVETPCADFAYTPPDLCLPAQGVSGE